MQRRQVCLTASEAQTLAEAAGRHRVLVLVSSFCGLRWGEAITLRVVDVDFLRRRLLVSTNAVQLGDAHHVGPTKDRRSCSVTVPAFLIEDLSRLLTSEARDELVCPPRASAIYIARIRATVGSPLRCTAPVCRQ